MNTTARYLPIFLILEIYGIYLKNKKEQNRRWICSSIYSIYISVLKKFFKSMDD
ncbi:hypothetical protein HMPREF3199_01862 [Enterococcus faecium]|nr:hypothetical protein HMPREF3199_01862 [Enterococcus faecium]